MAIGLTRRQWLGAALAVAAAPRLPLAQAQGRATRQPTTEVPWLAEVQQPSANLPEDAPQLPPLLVDEQGEPITTLADWQRRRAALRRRWLDFLGPLEVPGSNKPPALQVLEEDRVDGVVRQLVQYETEPGVRVDAYLLKPAAIERPRPGVVVLHSTTANTIRQPAGLEKDVEKAFGLQLARQGWVAICPRCFLWTREPSVPYDRHVRRFQARHPAALGIAKMLHDAQRAVDLLAALPEVDPQRLGAVGHSLGAKEVLYLAAFDERIRAAVSSEGGIGTRFSNWEASWYLGPQIHEPAFDREHHELLGLVAPRAFLLIGGDSADGDRSWPFIQAARQVYDLYGGTPRLGLFNHRQGHSMPPEAVRRTAQWMQAYGALEPIA